MTVKYLPPRHHLPRRLPQRFVLLVLLALTPALLGADAINNDSLRVKQDAQQRARSMARELITNVLDIQIRQLDENGLQDLTLYKDTLTMRRNIDTLVNSEMQKVILVLTQAQGADPAQQAAAFKQARQMIREIVAQLALERQSLLRRLKTAELIAQLKRLIEMESAAVKTTRALPQERQSRKETLALAAIEDQRDIQQLFLILVETLADVKNWGGPVGAGAADGLRLVKAADLEAELENVVRFLESAQFAPAVGSQESVIRGLRQLLERLEAVQGVLDADRQNLLEQIRALAERQEKLRAATQSGTEQPGDTSLVEEQSAIRKELAGLAQSVRHIPVADPLLERAQGAAYEAVGALFELQAETAVAAQAKVLASLDELGEKLRTAVGAGANDKSAREYAQLVRQLDNVRSQLAAAQSQQQQILQQIPAATAQASSAEAGLSAKIRAIANDPALPAGVKSRMSEAGDRVAEAAESLGQPQAAVAQNQQTAESAATAIERAAAEVAAALADAQRKQAAVTIGELARAAEMLERAAAAERAIAVTAEESAQGEGFPPEVAKRLQAEHSHVEGISTKVAAGISDTAREAAATVESALLETQAVAKELAAAEVEATSSKAQAGSISHRAERAAEKLAQAGSQVRQQIAQAARELAKLSQAQLAELATAREAVEQGAVKTLDSSATQMERLAAAEQKVRNAAAEQQRASGRPEAAQALETAARIDDALAQQRAADAAREALRAGKSNTPLEAAAQQQQVAEEISRAEAPGPQKGTSTDGTERGQEISQALKQALRNAQLAAKQAAKATLDGKTAQADAARSEVRKSLAESRQRAADAIATTAQRQAGKLDPKAQTRVSEAIAAARELAGTQGVETAKTLAEAATASNEASRQAAAQQPEKAMAAQRETESALETAAAQLRQSREALAQQASQTLSQQAENAAKLAEQSARLDPGATGALRNAEAAAKRNAARGSEMSAKEALSATEEISRNLERAVANLAGREEQVRRDSASAQDMLDVAVEQQAATVGIAEQREALKLAEADRPEGAGKSSAGTPAAQDQSPQGSPTQVQQQAAQALDAATQKYAAAQRATGQKAEEISGQSEVTNPPLREALEMADKLTWNQPSDAAPPEEPTSETAQQAVPTPAADSSAGTGFVSESPEVTAQMIAGERALDQMRAALQSLPGRTGPKSPASKNGLPSPRADTKGGQPQNSAARPNGSPRQSAKVASSSRERQDQDFPNDSKSFENGGEPAPVFGPRSATGSHDSNLRDNQFRQEPWFAKLPPELRKAMQAKPQRRAPRGYEERLRRYFESID